MPHARRCARRAALLLLAFVTACGTAELGHEGVDTERGITSQLANHGYNVYFGNTHSHTSYSDGQATPRQHFARAKKYGWDFYVTTDHGLAKYPSFAPNWGNTLADATAATDASFVAIRGYEHSENAGPKGHLNVFHPSKYLDASSSGVDLPKFYDWLVQNDYVACMNHPRYDNGYHLNNFAYLNKARRKQITMIEALKESSDFLDGVTDALDKGWRVAPVGALDNHSFTSDPADDPIAKRKLRTGVLATKLTRWQILQAMRARRVYATRDKNLKLSYTANGKIMGSVIYGPKTLSLDIIANDPNTGVVADKITKVQLLGKAREVIRSKGDFDAHSVRWRFTLSSVEQPYYWVRVFTGGSTEPTAYLAPVWIEACTSASQCDDGNVCTNDSCQAGVCEHQQKAACCNTNIECDDSDACTTDTCSANVCEHAPIASCCTRNDQCDDGDECTADSCSNNACESVLIDGCGDPPPEPEVDAGQPEHDAGTPLPLADSGAYPRPDASSRYPAQPDRALSGSCSLTSAPGDPSLWLLLLAVLFVARKRPAR